MYFPYKSVATPMQPKIQAIATGLDECIQTSTITPYTPNTMLPYLRAIKRYCEIAETTLGFVEGANNG